MIFFFASKIITFTFKELLEQDNPPFDKDEDCKDIGKRQEKNIRKQCFSIKYTGKNYFSHFIGDFSCTASFYNKYIIV